MLVGLVMDLIDLDWGLCLWRREGKGEALVMSRSLERLDFVEGGGLEECLEVLWRSSGSCFFFIGFSSKSYM